MSSSEEERKRKQEEDERAETLRQIKLEEARNLISNMNISSNANMPAPIQPGNFAKGTLMLQTNLFGIRMSEDRPIYKYDILISSDLGKKHVEFTKKGNSDYVVTEKKKNCMAVFQKGIKAMKIFRPDIVFFYDGQSIAYTMERLAFEDPSKPNETAILEGATVSSDLEHFQYIYFAIKECDYNGFECRLSDIRKVDPNIMKKDRSAMQFVDVATSMHALAQCDTRFTIFQNGKIFPSRPDLERIQTVKMKEGKVLIPGMTKSIKLIEGPRGRNNASPALAIDSLRAAFHEKQKLVDKALEIFPDFSRWSYADIESFATMVRGLGCMTNHMKKQRRIEIHGISKENASKRVEIGLDGGLKRAMSVTEYFKFKYNLDLKYPLAPLVMSREKGNVNLYPMEVLDVIPMQRVTISQTTSAQSQVATKECAVPPGSRQNAIMEQCKLHDLFNPEESYLKSAGISIIPAPLQVQSRILKGPVLQFAKSEMEVVSANWRPPANFQFAVPAKCARWALIAVLGQRDTLNKSDMERFAEGFVRRCRERGMTIDLPVEITILDPPPQGKSADFPAREKIKECAYHKCDLVFFITNDFINIHKHIKLQERYSNIVTQDLKVKTCINYLQKNQSLTMENIVYKTNVKLGGMNYAIHIKNVVGPSTPVFPSNRLILGIGVSHAPPCAEYISSTGVKLPSPSIVGYSANMARYPTEFVGDFLYQDSKKEDLLFCTAEMLQNVMDRFLGAVDSNGNRTGVAQKDPPSEMIVYRQGVSEGYYAMCLNEEIPLMKAVLAKNGAAACKVTYIIVTKENNTRLMPIEINLNEKPSAQNIGSGVVVDSQITHPRYREFFLNSHITLQGTARTPRYTILHDDSDFSMNAVEMITHALAHNFQIVNSPVSLPAPLYIANRYAERGTSMFTARATDELATSEQKMRVELAQMNEDLTYGHTSLGKVRINA